MTHVPTYQTGAQRTPIIGFAQISADEIWATGVTIEQLKVLLIRQATAASVEISSVPTQQYQSLATASTWQTINGRALTPDELERSLAMGVIAIKGPSAAALLADAQAAFALLLRSELAAAFIY
jgi:hypothetical protein